MNKKKALLMKIKKYDFAMKELNLYLDTHPNCRRALALFRQYKQRREKAVSEFISEFGPITPEQSDNNAHWSWIDDPWPWERS